MPTECERSLTSPTAGSTSTTAGGVASAALIAAEIQSSNSHEDLSQQQQQQQQMSMMMEGDMSTSQTSTTSNGSSCNGGIRKTSITSPDPTAYVAKARVTRPTPPPPPYNPMQFVQIKPCNLYQTAQEQLKKAEEVKKIKEIRKEEPEDWQNNLDNWKSSRRKRVEHIIDRVVEVKKLELEEHDRTRRKSKTFSELIENRSERVGRSGLNKLASLAVYNEDESNDLSDLGIGTSSASGKSSLSEDYDNNSVMSDNAAELDKAISNSNHHKPLTTESTTREYISSPGYETSSSTAPASSPDPCEYTYEGAIQDYKQRVSRAAASGLTSHALNKLSSQQSNSKESTPERAIKETAYPPRRGSKIEDRLIGFEVQSPSEECVGEKNKVDVPKIDISKRKEIFESQSLSETKVAPASTASVSGVGVPRVTLRDRFKPQEITEPIEVTAKKDVRRLSGDITSIKERLQSLEQQQNLVNGANGATKSTANKLVDIPVPPLKERLSSLQSAVTKEEVRKPPVALVDARQLEIMKSEEEDRKVKQTIKEAVKENKEEKTIATTITSTTTTTTATSLVESESIIQEVTLEVESSEVDRDDSGIHTADDIDITEDRLIINTDHIKKQQELKLNAAIEALAMEEKQFAEAASAVNQIEAEFEELTLGSVTLPPLASSNAAMNGQSSKEIRDANTTNTTTTNNNNNNNTTTTITNDHMEYSINEALELALEAIDKESNIHLIQIEESFQQPQIVPSNNHQQTQQSSTITTSLMQFTHINKTDEEKSRKLQNTIINLEKSEEEISMEPIYENVLTTTKGIYQKQQQQHIVETTTTYQEQEQEPQPHPLQQQSQIIPSMMSRQRQQQHQQQQLEQSCDELLQQQNNNQNLLITKNNDKFQNQNIQQQQQISQINSCLTAEAATTKTTTTTTTLAAAVSASTLTCSINNNNNQNNINMNMKNTLINNLNTNNDNLVELTTAFANQNITESLTAAANVTATAMTADNNNQITKIKNHDDNISVSIKTTNSSNNISNNNNNKNINNSKMLSKDTVHLNILNDVSSNVIIEQNPVKLQTTTIINNINTESLINPSTELSADSIEPYYQVPKSSEPYYDAPKHLRPIPVYENIEIFFNGSGNGELSSDNSMQLQPPKEKPPPPPIDSPPLFDDEDGDGDDDDIDSPMDMNYCSSDNTYETLSRHQQQKQQQHYQQQQQAQQQQQLNSLNSDHPSPPMKRMNSTKRIKKEIRNKRSSFLGIEGSSLDDDDSYLELTVAPPPDMAQLLQEERRLEKQLYLKAGLCDSSDTGESRDSGVSENHSRQSSEHYTNSSEENEPHDDTTSPLTLQTQTVLDNPTNDIIYQNDGLLAVAPTPLLQTVKGNSAESWTESATVAAAATQSLTEATATANAKMMSIEEKIREQEEVLRVERELLQLEQEELKRQRENLMLRESMARRELQHGAKMLMSANRRSLQDLNGLGAMTVMAGGGNIDMVGGGNNVEVYHMNQMNGYVTNQNYPIKGQVAQQQQQIYANIPNLQQQYYQMDTDYRKSMSDIMTEYSKHMVQPPPPVPPSKPMRSMHMSTANRLINGSDVDSPEFSSRQRHSLNSQHFGGSLVKIASQPTAAPRGGPPHIYSNYHHQSAQNLNGSASNLTVNNGPNQSLYPGNMSRNTLHALSATPKPKYTDGWVQVQQRKSYDTNFANDPAWVSAHQQKRKSMPEASYQHYNGNNHWLVQEAEQRRLAEQQQSKSKSMVNGGTSAATNGKPLPDSIIQTLTERVQSKGIGERKRNNLDKSPLHAASQYHQYSKQQQTATHQIPNSKQNHIQTSHIQLQSAPNGNRHQHSMSNSAMTTSVSSTNGNGQLINTTTSTTTTNITTSSQQDKVLSVSGKKKCSHCGDELGRGAAMIIESLLLFYHINCFKCCVCHVQLGDGLNGTDVRVRNHKLHCQNCYSSDDGIKFSCV